VYRSFKVKNFRCFDDLEIAPLERVNLIAGMNDVGKTALLEALFLHCGAWNVELIYRLNEWFKARRFGDDYYLYVVLNAATDPRLYIIRNPAARLQAEERVEGGIG